MYIITNSINSYNKIFASYIGQFLQWGQWLFYSCITISLLWLCIWKAFDSASFQEALSGFIKEFFVATLFYTIMLNAGPWLYSLSNTAITMGTSIAKQKVDPSSIINQGILIANSLVSYANNTSFLANNFSVLIVVVSYITIHIVFFKVALDLAVSLILNTILISMASMFLAFSALQTTRSIARNTLSLVISNSVKILTLYIVVAAGSDLIIKISEIISEEKVTILDTFGWVVAGCLLFGATSKYIPDKISKIFKDMFIENNQVVYCIDNKFNKTATSQENFKISDLKMQNITTLEPKSGDKLHSSFGVSDCLYEQIKTIASKKKQ